MTPISLLFALLWQLLVVLLTAVHGGLNLIQGASGGGGGSWQLLQRSIGITAMHMQLLNNDRVVIFDRTDFGESNISLPNGRCRDDPNEAVVPHDCTAHSVEYDVVTNRVRPLFVQTDVWCSSGSLFPDGRLIQTGGFNNGDRVVRIFKPCGDCDWEEIPYGLTQRRWYATNHILPGGQQIIIGGRRQFNYEFYPKTASTSKYYNLRLLVQTNVRDSEDNLYPFVFLNVDGNLFIFANYKSILFDYVKGVVVKTFPDMPDGQPRCYPSTGSAVLLPLKIFGRAAPQPEVLVCGGAPKGSFLSAKKYGKFVGALKTCGRIRITDPEPKWVMETMPLARVMGDMLLLPNTDVLIINGGSAGTAGWEYGRDPVFNPVIYMPDNPIGSRFDVLNPSTIPRMYHSTAILLRDGRVLVGGSNPHTFYNFTGVLFPTELRLEAFSPPYLDPKSDTLRPKIITPASQAEFKYGQSVTVQFTVTATLDANSVTVTMIAPSFNTHSFSMNQRLLVLGEGNVVAKAKSTYETRVTMPGSGNLAPAGYYLLFVVHQKIPSPGIWIHIQ
ncbi:aldehyde oxidase GLOX [Diospyros lotus]|uniref:aldehyde oxidase GLOX n=1 Tax=Diospyros lotus TaxID=55363 RepID=UPI002259A6A6|nr:aldehyde oxidase GLOX [Diospyros lotus]